MNNKYKKKSIRAYPFKSVKLTPKEKLFKSTLDEWYSSAKHCSAPEDEVAFINSIKIKNCLYYGSAQFIKDGHKNINEVNVPKLYSTNKHYF